MIARISTLAYFLFVGLGFAYSQDGRETQPDRLSAQTPAASFEAEKGQNAKSQALHVFPNPVYSQDLTVMWPEEAMGKATILLLNSHFNTVWKGQFTVGKDILIPNDALGKPGVYLVLMYCGNQVHRAKVLKQSSR